MIKSQDELNTCNDGNRGSEVLVATIEKCAALEKENERLKELLKECSSIFEDITLHTDYNEVGIDSILTRINAAIGESEE